MIDFVTPNDNQSGGDVLCDKDGAMLDAGLPDGDALVPMIERFFGDPDVAYLQAHFAKRGCHRI